MPEDFLEKYLCKESESLKTVDSHENICDFSHNDFYEYHAPLGDLIKEYLNLFSTFKLFRGKKWRAKEESLRKILNNHQYVVWHKKDGEII